MKHLILKIVILTFISLYVTAQNGQFTFTILSQAHTSAGVFKKDSTLIRTLWNDIVYPAGTYTQFWDGKDDNGVAIISPDSNYQVKVLSNNVQYKWDGIIGNTSDSITGVTKHKSLYNCMSNMVFANNKYAYYSMGYNEGSASQAKFDVAKPQQKIAIPGASSNTNINFLATDNINVYWSCVDPYNNTHSFVFATRVLDDSQVSFSAGRPYKLTRGSLIPKVISHVKKKKSVITGMAVEKTGDYLFVARAGLNEVQVLNKTTGALVKTLKYNTPRSICMDGNDNLWMVSGVNTVSKYAISVKGDLSAPILTLSGLLEPLAIRVSFDGTTITVADGSTSQQVKGFNNATGTASWTLGAAGGYFNDANVTNNKFYFSDLRGYDVKYRPVFLAFQSDGSLWIGDGGNSRIQHYSSNRTFINTIMSLGASYEVYVDPNNPTRIWSDALEFSIDYSKPLTGTTGWKLVKNWGANLTSAYHNYFAYPTTFSNGRTYAFIRRYAGNSTREVVEFPATGQLRFTGVLNYSPRIIAPDGAMQVYNKAGIGGKSTIYRYALTGFSAANNPVWSGTGELLATTPALTINDPNDLITGNCITSSNKIVLWNPDRQVDAKTPYIGNHLASINRGNNKWLWRTEQATHDDYVGAYPKAGYFDIGNNVNQYAGGTLSILGRNVITSYHGEFWKNSQTNKYNHYYDNGLAIGQFGVTGPETVGINPAMISGNSLTPMIVADPGSPNSMYLFHGDESVHGGLHRWKITDLNTISEQEVTIPFPSLYVIPASDCIDLMAGLPFDVPLVNNTAGWTRTPLLNINGSKKWNLNTSRNSYTKLTGNDISIAFEDIAVSTNSVSRDLGVNNVSSSWKLSGEIIYPSTNNVNGQFAQEFLEVLDANNKVLTTFYISATSTQTSIYGNSAVLMTSPSLSKIQKEITKTLPFEVKIVSGVVTFVYGNYPAVTTTISDASGNWKTPKTMRVTMLRNSLLNPARRQAMVIKDFKFCKDVTMNVANKLPVANAGATKMVAFPSVTTTLTGAGTDRDGTVTSYAWAKLSGPVAGTVSSKTAAITLANLQPGVYTYQLTVTDDRGGQGKDTVQVTVNADPKTNRVQPKTNISSGMSSFDDSLSTRTTKMASPIDITALPNSSTINSVSTTRDSIAFSRETADTLMKIIDKNNAENTTPAYKKEAVVLGSGLSKFNYYANALKVYPNPINAIANLDITVAHPNSKLSISIFNSSGMLINKKDIFTSQNKMHYELDMSHLSDGIYLIITKFDDGQKIHYKIIKVSG